MTDYPTKLCEGCAQPVIWARTTGRKTDRIPLDPEPTTAGSYRLNRDTADQVRARKLTPTERTTTGFGAKAVPLPLRHLPPRRRLPPPVPERVFHMTQPLPPELVREIGAMHWEDREWQRRAAPVDPPRPVLAIDPGNVDSAYAVVGPDLRPLRFGKVPNEELLARLPSISGECRAAAIEMVASYGMAVGAEVFDTCVWIGRYLQCLESLQRNLAPVHRKPVRLVKRLPVKIHFCHDSKAKDSNIRQALVDRFAPGVGNYGKGTKAQPGWFYGFSADVWSAYALGVYAVDVAL